MDLIAKDKAGGEVKKQSIVEKLDKNEVNEEYIFVKVLDGKTLIFFVKPTFKIRNVVRLIEATLAEGQSLEDARLSYGSKPLEDIYTLDHYNIEAGSTLFLNGRIHSGGVDSSKYCRLPNLFIFAVRGHPDHDDLMNQLNKLSTCDTNTDLKEYDWMYLLHRLN